MTGEVCSTHGRDEEWILSLGRTTQQCFLQQQDERVRTGSIPLRTETELSGSYKVGDFLTERLLVSATTSAVPMIPDTSGRGFFNG
jgi:hypothetical protein